MAATLVLLGCDAGVLSRQVEAAPIDDPRETSAAAAPMRIQGMKFYTFDTRPTGDQKRKPAFRMEAETCVQQQDDLWAMEGVKATIYSGQDDPIEMVAGQGRFDERGGEGKEVAILSGGVVVFLGELQMEMPRIRWDNATQEAVSEGPVTVLDEGHRLVAQELHIYPRENRYVLTNGKGSIPLDRRKP